MYLLVGTQVDEHEIMVMGQFDLSQPQNAAMDITKGVVVETVLQAPPYKAGTGYSYRANLTTGEQWYAEFPIPYTMEERLDILQKAAANQATEATDTMLALTEAYELILSLNQRIEALEAKTGGEA